MKMIKEIIGLSLIAFFMWGIMFGIANSNESEVPPCPEKYKNGLKP